MDARRKLRIGQFSLRTLVVVLTLASVACGVVAYRRDREAQIGRFVEHFNAAMDKQDLENAERIVDEMVRKFPREDVTELIGWKLDFAKKMASCEPSVWEGCLDN
jgi:hypothetical protein